MKGRGSVSQSMTLIWQRSGRKNGRLPERMDDGIVTDRAAKKLTVNALFERYIESKKLADSTRSNYIAFFLLPVPHYPPKRPLPDSCG